MDDRCRSHGRRKGCLLRRIGGSGTTAPMLNNDGSFLGQEARAAGHL